MKFDARFEPKWEEFEKAGERELKELIKQDTWDMIEYDLVPEGAVKPKLRESSVYLDIDPYLTIERNFILKGANQQQQYCFLPPISHPLIHHAVHDNWSDQNAVFCELQRSLERERRDVERKLRNTEIDVIMEVTEVDAMMASNKCSKTVIMDRFGREYSMKCSTGALGTDRAGIQDATSQHWSYCSKLVELVKENESDTLYFLLALRVGLFALKYHYFRSEFLSENIEMENMLLSEQIHKEKLCLFEEEVDGMVAING